MKWYLGLMIEISIIYTESMIELSGFMNVNIIVNDKSICRQSIKPGHVTNLITVERRLP